MNISTQRSILFDKDPGVGIRIPVTAWLALNKSYETLIPVDIAYSLQDCLAYLDLSLDRMGKIQLL